VPPLLGLGVDQVQTVIESTSTALILKEGDQIHVVDDREPAPQARMVGRTWPVSESIVYQELVRRRTPINLADLWESSLEAQALRDAHAVGGVPSRRLE
jgi:hypothetical protein